MLEFQNTNPERGRKLYIHCVHYGTTKFQNTNPERGRKRAVMLREFVNDPISEHEPRKGTETDKTEWRNAECLDLNFRTRTPKGDGNFHNTTPLILFLTISEHEPRKGTETSASAYSLLASLAYFRTRTPKGDGNYKYYCY